MDRVFEMIVRPTTWDGDEQDVRIGLYTDLLQAIHDAQIWIAAHPYPFMIGEWETVSRQIKLNTLLARMPD